MILKFLNKKFNKIFIILLIICIFNIFLYNFKSINVNIKETFIEQKDAAAKRKTLEEYKEKIIIKNRDKEEDFKAS